MHNCIGTLECSIVFCWLHRLTRLTGPNYASLRASGTEPESNVECSKIEHTGQRYSADIFFRKQSLQPSPCAKYHITKENAIAHICDAINFPADRLQFALTTAPHKFCAVISETCKMFAVVGKCKTECPTLLEKCKNMLPSHGHCEDKCLDTTCVTSDFCFCPQNAWKSCTSCKPGCKLRNVDPNGHKDCAGGMCNTIVVFECILCHTFDWEV